MAQISEGLRRAMIQKGLENRRLREENAAFGGHHQRMEAMYGRQVYNGVESHTEAYKQALAVDKEGTLRGKPGALGDRPRPPKGYHEKRQRPVDGDTD